MKVVAAPTLESIVKIGHMPRAVVQAAVQCGSQAYANMPAALTQDLAVALKTALQQMSEEVKEGGERTVYVDVREKVPRDFYFI